MLATASLIALLPQVILGPFVGTLVDRWNRRLIMIIADSVSALALVVMTYLFWRGDIQVWQVFIIMFVRSLCAGFHQPAMQASVTLMVPKEFYSRVQGMNQAMMGLMTILAAPAGALLLELLPIYGILAIDIVTAIIAVIPLLLIRIPQPARQTSTDLVVARPSLWQDFKEGLRYVFSWSGLVLILVMTALINLLLTPASSLLPILVTKAYQGQALNLAEMQSAFGVGTIIGGIILGVWGGFRRRIVTSLSGLILLGVVIISLGLVPAETFILAVALAFVLGFTTPIINGPLFAVVQSAVDPQMQGRVFTLITSLATAMAPIGLIVAGPVADMFGVRVWYMIGGAITILLALVSFSIPAVMHIEDGRAPRLAEKEPVALPPVP
jgi:DHA3 family macrolide efflux protein-like MFS transporter